MRDNLLARETYLSADNNIKKYISQNSKDKEEQQSKPAAARLIFTRNHIFMRSALFRQPIYGYFL